MLSWINYCNVYSLKKQAKMCALSWTSLISDQIRLRNLKVFTLTYLSLQKVYLCGIILQNLSCTCWMYTNITGSRLARVLHVLLLSCNYSCHRLSRALSPCYSSSRKWKQGGYIASKQVKLKREILKTADGNKVEGAAAILIAAIKAVTDCLSSRSEKKKKKKKSEIWRDFPERV